MGTSCADPAFDFVPTIMDFTAELYGERSKHSAGRNLVIGGSRYGQTGTKLLNIQQERFGGLPITHCVPPDWRVSAASSFRRSLANAFAKAAALSGSPLLTALFSSGRSIFRHSTSTTDNPFLCLILIWLWLQKSALSSSWKVHRCLFAGRLREGNICATVAMHSCTVQPCNRRY